MKTFATLARSLCHDPARGAVAVGAPRRFTNVAGRFVSAALLLASGVGLAGCGAEAEPNDAAGSSLTSCATACGAGQSCVAGACSASAGSSGTPTGGTMSAPQPGGGTGPSGEGPGPGNGGSPNGNGGNPSGNGGDVSGDGNAPGTGGSVFGNGGFGENGGNTNGNGGDVSGSGNAPGTGGSIFGNGGTASGEQGWLIQDMCYPLCANASTDPDGDGWGWENEASCVVVGAAPYNGGTPCGGGSGVGGNASGNGGTAAGVGGTPGAGGSGSSACNVAPVNPNASTQVRNLLCYLYSVYGTGVLSGQQETSWDNPEDDISWYNDAVGKYPAILGGDYLYPDGTTDRAIAYWQAGGISMLRYHMGAPPNSDTYEDSQGDANIGNVLSPGTQENQSFISKLDYVASELQRLEDAGVPVIWAPFHEFQPGGWFWWSKGSAEEFKQLWTTMFDYLTTTKGLNNLLWLAPSSGSPEGSWYPAKNYYDVAGPDTYGTNPPFTSMFNDAEGIIGTTVPITLHETGVVPQPSSMFPSTAPWVMWNIWAGYQESENDIADIQSAYNSPYTITRDEVPDLN